jgi:hypothetical protein
MPAPAGIVVFGEKQADSSACAGDSKGFACKRIRGLRSCRPDARLPSPLASNDLG